jgi:hypothetical protein
MKTESDLATAVLRELGVVDADETPDSSDSTLVIDVYRSKWEEIASHGNELVYWSRSSIPLPVFLIVRDLIMNEVRGTFGEPQLPEERDARENVILKRLRRHVATQSSGLSVRATYY